MNTLLHPWFHSLISTLMVIVILICAGVFFLEVRRYWRLVRPSSRSLKPRCYPDCYRCKGEEIKRERAQSSGFRARGDS